MRLSDLIEVLPEKTVRGDAGVEISGIMTDSRKVTSGGLFIAVSGTTEDGHRYIRDALERGAIALVGEAGQFETEKATVIEVPGSRMAAAFLAEAFYGYPSKQLEVVGITGTNGKSSTLFLVRSVLSEAGFPSSGIGTIGYSIGGEEIPAVNTTPGPIELSMALRQALDTGHRHVVMEVSSHALDQYRVEAVRFKVGVYTNLSLDHLDYHSSTEEYFNAKRHLFELLPDKSEGAYAVIGADDDRAEDIAAATTAEKLTFGIEREADLRATDVELGTSHTSFRMTTPQGDLQVSLKLLGQHSVYNALAASATCMALGIDIATIKAGLESLDIVPGRFERICEGQTFEVIVDYAHTPEAIDLLLRSARALCKGKLIVVFGAGGDRDRTKRPEMGKLAASLADFSVVTSDNPRSEDPFRIALDIEIGFQKQGKERGQDYLVIIDRREAIEEALATAEADDIVIIAGKGHETTQTFRDRTIEFDDRVIARTWLQTMSKLDKRRWRK